MSDKSGDDADRAKRQKITEAAGLPPNASGDQVLATLFNDTTWEAANGHLFTMRTFANGRRQVIPMGPRVVNAPVVPQVAAAAAAQQTAAKQTDDKGSSKKTPISSLSLATGRGADMVSPVSTASADPSSYASVLMAAPQGQQVRADANKKDSPSWGVVVERATKLLMDLSYQDRLRALKALNAATGFPQASASVLPTPRAGASQTDLSETGSRNDKRTHGAESQQRFQRVRFDTRTQSSASTSALQSTLSTAAEPMDTLVVQPKPPKERKQRVHPTNPDGTVKEKGPKRQPKQDVNNDPEVKRLLKESLELKKQLKTEAANLKLKEGEKVPNSNPVVVQYREALQAMHAARLRFRNAQGGGQSTNQSGSEMEDGDASD